MKLFAATNRCGGGYPPLCLCRNDCKHTSTSCASCTPNNDEDADAAVMAHSIGLRTCAIAAALDAFLPVVNSGGRPVNPPLLSPSNNHFADPRSGLAVNVSANSVNAESTLKAPSPLNWLPLRSGGDVTPSAPSSFAAAGSGSVLCTPLRWTAHSATTHTTTTGAPFGGPEDEQSTGDGIPFYSANARIARRASNVYRGGGRRGCELGAGAGGGPGSFDSSQGGLHPPSIVRKREEINASPSLNASAEIPNAVAAAPPQGGDEGYLCDRPPSLWLWAERRGSSGRGGGNGTRLRSASVSTIGGGSRCEEKKERKAGCGCFSS